MDSPPPQRPRDRNAEGRPENARPRDRFGAPLPRGAVDALADRVDPAVACATVDDAIRGALERFDQQRFFEAHEFFEWAWKRPGAPPGDRVLFKGLAQVAVGYTHAQRGNVVGARRLLERGAAALQGHHGPTHGIDLARVVADARAFARVLDEGDGGPALTYPRFPEHG